MLGPQAELARWLRDLADAVVTGEVCASDIAQALFRADDYTVLCTLSEAENEPPRFGKRSAHELLARADALYPQSLRGGN